MAAKVDVVIPVRNRWDLTKRCLEHLRRQTVAHTVIVCDNGSSDGTPHQIREAFPDVTVVELGANRGFTVACNRGADAGAGELIVLLNNDVECRPDFLERLAAPFRDNSRLGSAAALLVLPDERHIESFGLSVDATVAGYPRLRGVPMSAAQSDGAVLIGPSGAAGAYRREAWLEVGGLDEGVRFYGEDVDLALRLGAAGWTTTAVKDAVAIHVGSASASHRSAWQRYEGGFARGYFLRRYGVLKSRAALRALATEALVVTGDALVFSHDLAALRGRLAGWSAAAGLPPVEFPRDAIDAGITFAKSVRARLNVYSESTSS